MNEPELIEAIRSHPLVGRGSCTAVDECYDASELWEAFGPPAGNHTIAAAIEAAIEAADLHVEQSLNARWGEDDDPQLAEAREWERMKREAAP